MENEIYKSKYLKYKEKYISLKNEMNGKGVVKDIKSLIHMVDNYIIILLKDKDIDENFMMSLMNEYNSYVINKAPHLYFQISKGKLSDSIKMHLLNENSVIVNKIKQILKINENIKTDPNLTDITKNNYNNMLKYYAGTSEYLTLQTEKDNTFERVKNLKKIVDSVNNLFLFPTESQKGLNNKNKKIKQNTALSKYDDELTNIFRDLSSVVNFTDFLLSLYDNSFDFNIDDLKDKDKEKKFKKGIIRIVYHNQNEETLRTKLKEFDVKKYVRYPKI